MCLVGCDGGAGIVQSLLCLGYGVNNQDLSFDFEWGGEGVRDFSPLTSIQPGCWSLLAFWVHGYFFSGVKWLGHESYGWMNW